jgi:hypothetical protein
VQGSWNSVPASGCFNQSAVVAGANTRRRTRASPPGIVSRRTLTVNTACSNRSLFRNVAVFVIARDAERAAEFFGQRRLAEQAGVFEPGEVGEIAQARQSPQGQEGRRRHKGMGSARLRAARPGGDQIGAAKGGDHVAADVGNVWIADFAGNKAGTKGHQVHKFSPTGEKLLSLGVAGKAGNADGEFNQPNDVVVGPDSSIYVADGHEAQGMITANAVAEGIKRGATSRISKFSPDEKFIKSWGGIGVRHGEFRTPHSLAFDARGRLWVADRGNHRIEIFDQNGTYLESRYMFGRPSGLFIKGDTVYVIDSESGPYNHPNWRDGVRIGPVDEDRVTGFIPPFERDDRVYQGAAGEGVAVDADGNVYAAEGPNSLAQAGGAFTKYSVGR